jgi:DNA polymerase III delta subunit
MNQQALRTRLQKGIIDGKYLLIGTEPLLLENTVQSIKEALKIDEQFDYDTFSASETPLEEFASKLYLAPFGSKHRLIVIKYLEELDARTLSQFATLMNKISSSNCVVMTYRIDKSGKKGTTNRKKLSTMFNNTTEVRFQSDPNQIRKWIAAKIKRDNLSIPPSMVNYLADEFSNDITGLKNEFDKLENYLYEVGTISENRMKDLTQGLFDFNKYEVIDAFIKGKPNTITKFQSLHPFLRSYAGIVDALVRGIMYRVQRSRHTTKQHAAEITRILDEIVNIDSKVKRSSFFQPLHLELFFLKHARMFGKGATHGR